MSRISFENGKDKITIINRLSYPEAVNERVYNAILSGMTEGLMPVFVKQQRKETRIECVARELIPLSQYFGGIVTKKMFLDFVHKIAVEIKECEKNMINANNLDLQSDRIFIDPQTKKVMCVFWPIVNNQRDEPPQNFLKRLPYELKFDPNENSEYLHIYNEFFNSLTPFSVNSFDKMILRLLGRNSSDGLKTPSEKFSGGLGGEGSSNMYTPLKRKNADIEYDPFAQNDGNTAGNGSGGSVWAEGQRIFCTACGRENPAGSNFCIYCGTKLHTECREQTPEPQRLNAVPDGTTVLGNNSGTVVLGYDEADEPVYPALIRERTGGSFPVDKPDFKIGAEQRKCDLFIGDNRYISRMHADIITHDGRYYIVDKNSTNKTFVDGKVIPPDTETEIFPGTKIRLADEDFTFVIES